MYTIIRPLMIINNSIWSSALIVFTVFVLLLEKVQMSCSFIHSFSLCMHEHHGHNIPQHSKYSHKKENVPVWLRNRNQYSVQHTGIYWVHFALRLHASLARNVRHGGKNREIFHPHRLLLNKYFSYAIMFFIPSRRTAVTMHFSPRLN